MWNLLSIFYSFGIYCRKLGEKRHNLAAFVLLSATQIYLSLQCISSVADELSYAVKTSKD